MREALAESQTPLILCEALARCPRRRPRSRTRLPFIASPKVSQPGLSPSPLASSYNNYLSSAPPSVRKPPAKNPGGKVGLPGEAPRRAGAPLGNRNAVKRLPAHWIAFEAKYRDFMARAAEAIARAEILIAAQAKPVIRRRILHITVIRDGVVVREREVRWEREVPLKRNAAETVAKPAQYKARPATEAPAASPAVAAPARAGDMQSRALRAGGPARQVVQQRPRLNHGRDHGHHHRKHRCHCPHPPARGQPRGAKTPVSARQLLPQSGTPCRESNL